MAAANLVVRFVVELIGVGAFGYWGLQASSFGPARIALGLGAPLALMVVWAIVVAPNAVNALSQPRRAAIGTGLLLAAAVALAVAGQPIAAVVFGAAVILNWLFLVVLGPDTAASMGWARGRSR